MCNSHSLRVIYVLCSCIDIFNLVGFVLSLCTLHVVWSSGYKTSNFSRSLHEVEVSTFMYSRVDFVLLCERGLTHTYHGLRTYGQRYSQNEASPPCNRRCTSYRYFAVSLSTELP